MYFDLNDILFTLVNEPDQSKRDLYAFCFKNSRHVREALEALRLIPNIEAVRAQYGKSEPVDLEVLSVTTNPATEKEEEPRKLLT